MALLSSLRNKTHIILYVLLAAFLALIVFEWGMQSNFIKPQNVAGKVNGASISYQEYDNAYKALSENVRRANPEMELTPEIEHELQERAWNSLVDQRLLEEQFRKFGITVQDREVVEAMNSPQPPMVIRQYFTDPATGKVDRQKLDNARRDPANRDMWLQLEKYVRMELQENKLLRAFQAFERVTDREVSDMVNRKVSLFTASFIPLPLSAAGDDKSFPITDDEIKKYYNEHKELFRQEKPSRKVETVFFPLIPSAKDSAAVRQELEGLRADFSKSQNDADFVKVQSDRSNSANVVLTRANFSQEAGNAIFNNASLAPGSLIGPIADNGEYRLLKVVRMQQAAQPIARASHILLRFNPANKAEAEKVQQLTMQIGQQLQAGVPFETLAKKYSADPGSAERGGDLGWFSPDRMVPEFSKAVFSSRPGAIIGPIQTQFGIHIIKVTGFDQRALVASEVVRTIRSSSESVESQRRRAMAFQVDAKEKGFAKSATTAGVKVEESNEFTRRMAIRPIGYNDKVATFAFSAKEGDISDVIESDKGFYVVRLSAKHDDGYRSLDKELKERIKQELLVEKKGAALQQKLAAAAKAPNATLAQIAATVGSQVVKADGIRWADGFIPNYGVDRVLVEAISGMTAGKLSKPVKTSNGYALVLLERKSIPDGFDPKAVNSMVAPQLLRAKHQQLFTEYFQSLRNVEDLRP